MTDHPLLLIAEDDPDDQFLIQDAIKTGCPPHIEAYFAWDGEQLVQYLTENAHNHSNRPKLVVLDLNMPRKDGRAALQEIKADPRLADVPVAVLTTSINPADARFCHEQGAVGYFRKPPSMNELRKILSDLCQDYLG